MRLSTDKNDPGYRPDICTSKAKVFFNGTEMQYVITADEEKRFILQIVMDERGKLCVTPDRTEWLTEVRYGDVRIELNQ